MSLDSIVSVIFQFKFPIIFYSLVLLFVYINRKKFDIIGKFIFLYRTKFGLNFMEYVANRARKLIKVLGYIGIVFGFIGMIFTFILILILTYKLLLNVPGAGGASPVIPGLPIAGTGLIFPLISGWIAIFIIVVVHEFSHGIVAKAHNIRIKNSGIAFFGPILGAFVEPDEKKLVKQKDSVQHSVFAAGPFSNLILTVVAYLILVLVFAPLANSLVDSSGIIISPQPGLPAEKTGVTNFTTINQVNGIEVNTVRKFQDVMEDITPGEVVTLTSEKKSFSITTIENPEKPSQAYLGVFVLGEDKHLKNQNIFTTVLYRILSWFVELLVWVAFLSINIGLINLLPIFITDGARMLKVAFDRIIPNKDKRMSLWLFINWLSTFSLVLLVFLPFFRWLGASLSVLLTALFI